MDVDPEHIRQAAEASTSGTTIEWLVGALSLVGGFVFKDGHRRLKALEVVTKDMATKTDIENVYERIEKLNKESTDRIITLYRDKEGPKEG